MIALPIRSARLALALALGLLAPLGARAEGYTLQQGDRLALSVVGAPELKEAMTIDIDGNILVPLVGPVPAAGRSLDEVSEAVRAALGQASYTVVSASGELLTLQVMPASVSLSMADYRPVYVDGDVQAPGAFAYAPGLTARRAVALAGGYGLAVLRGTDPTPPLLELQGDRRKLLADRAAAQARLARVKAHLAENASGEVPALAPDPAANAVGQVFAETERQRLEADRQRKRETAEHYHVAIAKTEGQIATLEQRLKGETEGVVADTEDYQRLVEAKEKGTVSVARLSDGRRTLLFSTTRELETKSTLDRAEMELEDLTHARDSTEIDDHATHLADLSEVTLALEATNAALAATERQIVYYQGVVADPYSDSDISIRITRPDGSLQELAAGEDPVLRPGDLVSVRLALPRGEITN